MARPVSASGNDNSHVSPIPVPGSVQKSSGNEKSSCFGRILGVLEKLALPTLAGVGICGIMLVCGLPMAVAIPVGVGIGLLVLGMLAVRWANARARDSLKNEPTVTYIWDQANNKYICKED